MRTMARKPQRRCANERTFYDNAYQEKADLCDDNVLAYPNPPSVPCPVGKESRWQAHCAHVRPHRCGRTDRGSRKYGAMWGIGIAKDT